MALRNNFRLVETLLSSRIGLNIVILLAQVLPPGLGYRLAHQVAGWLAARRQSELVQSVRSNQIVVAEDSISPAQLDRRVQAVLRNSARSIYELYHYFPRPQEAQQLFVFEPSFQKLIERPEFDQRGVIVAGLHMSSFDLALRLICRLWIRPLVLTIPNPRGGRQMEFEIRRRSGMNLVPATVAGLRQALRHLKRGGMVVTGIDRAEPMSEFQPRFFGKPARLPVHHTFLALKANVPVVVVASQRQDDGKYHIRASDPIEMEHSADLNHDLLYNTERVLALAEQFIRQTPEQWIMSRAVWLKVPESPVALETVRFPNA